MFYQVDSARVSVREYLAGTRTLAGLLALPIALLLKLFRVRAAAGYDEPPIDGYSSYRVREANIEPELLEKLLPVENELAELGFHSPVYHAVEDANMEASFRMVTLRHDSGEVIARVQFRRWNKRGIPKSHRERLLIWFLSVGADGREWATSNLGSDFTLPPGRRLDVCRGASAAEVWERHQRLMQEAQVDGPLRSIETQIALLETIDAYQQRYAAFQRERGVFMEPTEDTVRLSQQADGAPVIEAADPDAPVLDAIAKSQQSESNWVSGLVLLAISIGLFVSLGGLAWSWEFALLAVPILLFHELGHFVAMKLFKYRNMKMFFIPLFGAAVTGRHYNVPGWKKAIVSLAGPTPGIAVGGALAIAAMATNNDLLTKLSAVMLALNAFNLVPLLPLDGGWVAHTLFFSRHPLVDAGFRVMTAGLLLAAGYFTGDRIFLFLGVVTLLGVAWAYRLAKIASRLRKQGVDATPAAGDELPLDVTKRVIGEVRAASKVPLRPKQLAQMSTRVIEILNARPPGIAATLGLSFVHIASFGAAVVFGAMLFIHANGGFWQLMATAASRGDVEVACGAHVHSPGPAVADAAKVALVTATFPSGDEAVSAYHEASLQSDGAALTRFGNSLLIAIPDDDAAARTRWFDWLNEKTDNAFVSRAETLMSLTISGIAANETAAAEMERVATEYLDASAEMHLVPPWQPDFALSESDARGRATYHRLLTEPYDEEADDLGYEDLSARWEEASRRGDDEAMEEIDALMSARTEEAQQRRIDAIRAAGAEVVDLELIDLYLRHQEELEEGADFEGLQGDELEAALEEFQTRRAALDRQVGARMGQLPLTGDAPAPETLVYATSGGFVARSGRMVTMRALAPYRPDIAAPRLLDWLCERGCEDIRYTLEATPFFDGP